MVSHSVPMGETEVGRHAHVHAVDGEIGQVEGFMVNRADQKTCRRSPTRKEAPRYGPGDLLLPSAANVAGRRARSTAAAMTPASSQPKAMNGSRFVSV
jgi:hypothetical protein